MNTETLYLDQQKKLALDTGFHTAFGNQPDRYFSAPGRTEIGGNHTDHQRGRVLAAAVNLDTVAAVRRNDTDEIRILSKGYPMCQICVSTSLPKYAAIALISPGTAAYSSVRSAWSAPESIMHSA